MRWRQIALGITLFLLAPAAASAGPVRNWQDGEVLSRRTIPQGRTFLKNRYVYRVRGPSREYVVVSPTPLPLDLYVPIKFAADGRQILIQGSDGQEMKVRILRRASVTFRQ